MRYALIAVEGWTDVSFVAKVLAVLGVDKQVTHKDDIDPFWANLMPSDPPEHGRLWERRELPQFADCDDPELSVAIFCLGGKRKLGNLNRLLEYRDEYREDLSAFSVVLDADNDSPAQIHKLIEDGIPNAPSQFPAQAGTIENPGTAIGYYTFPNNKQHGVLESTLLTIGELAYSKLIADSRVYVDTAFDRHHTTPKPFDKLKSEIGAAVSILQPGYSTAVSLKDNDWLTPSTINEVDDLSAFSRFLIQLLTLGKPDWMN